MQSRAKLPGAHAPDETAVGLTPDQALEEATTADPTQGEETNAEQQPRQPTDLVPTWVMPDSTEGVAPQTLVVQINPRADTTAPTPAPAATVIVGPPGFPQRPGVLGIFKPKP